LGLSESSLGHRRREEFPATFLRRGGRTILKDLSIFIDESGDFGNDEQKTSYYLVTMLYHDQSDDIQSDIEKLEEIISLLGYDIEYIHVGPIIRRESVFEKYSIDDRRKLLYSMLNFINHCDFRHDTIIVKRSEAPDRVTLSGKIAKAISKRFDNSTLFFQQFDKIIVYYDNGQAELSAVLNAVFSMRFANVEFRKAEPQKYRLLQVADFICTFEFLNIKRNEKRLSKSEEKFFYKPNELRKTFIKSVIGKRITE
jgi:hypothetical protein